VIVLNSEPLPFRTKKNLPLDLNHYFIQPSGLDPAQRVHALLVPLLFLTVTDKGLVLSRTIAQDSRSRVPKHALVGGHSPRQFIRLLPSPLSENVNNPCPEFSEHLHRVHRVAKRFEARCSVVSQIAFYRGRVRDVNLVREALNVQEGEDAAFIERQSKRNEKEKRSFLRHLSGL